MHAIRVKREFEMLRTNLPPGVTVWPTHEDSLNHLTAEMVGPPGTPYEKGSFKLNIVLGEKYPIEPPQITFITKIYHPNIDESGRICLDSLKQIPKTGWMPIMTLYSLISQLQLLLRSPNPDDPLVVEIAEQYINNRKEYENSARQHTLKYAVNSTPASD